MNKSYQETMIIAAQECLAGMPQRELAKKLIEAQAERLRYEGLIDQRIEENMCLRNEVEAAVSVLKTIINPVGDNDLLTLCEMARSEVKLLRGRPPF